MSYRDDPEDIDQYIRVGKYLSNATETNILSEEQLEYIRKYQNTLYHLKRKRKDLLNIRNRISELSLEENTINTIEIADLEESAQDITTIIWEYRNYLNKLERTHMLGEIIERESVKSTLIEQEPELEEILKRYGEHRQTAPQQTESKRTETVNVASQDKGLKHLLFTLLLMSLSLSFPLIMLDAPFGIILVVIAVIYLPCILMFVSQSAVLPPFLQVVIFYLYHLVRPILYIWALVVTILGVQDFFAIAFYILLGLQAPKMIMNFVGTVLIIISALTNNE